MPGQKAKKVALGVTIQPTPGTFNAPVQADLIPVQQPDDGRDANTADDPTETGSLLGAPRVFLGTKGRAGATATLRGPGGATPFAANAWPIGRILQAAGFTEIINAALITGTAQAGGTTTTVRLAAGTSAVDDFYKGMVIQHANIGTGLRANSIIRGYNGTTKDATLSELLGSAVVSGTYNIPPQVLYALGTLTGTLPLLSCSVWRDGRRRDYRDCAVSSFAINIPVANDQGQDFPSIEFALVGVPAGGADTASLVLPQAALTTPQAALAGKFAFANQKIGHQTMRFELGLDTGAPPNQNFDLGQEGYEVLGGTRTLSLDLNQQLAATLDIDALVDAQTPVAVQSIWGQVIGNRFAFGVPNNLLNPMNPGARNGFVGVSGDTAPSDIDRSATLSLIF